METKVQIKKYIQSYKATDVKLLYEVMSNILLGNQDFRLAGMTGPDDIRPEMEKETGETIDFSMESVLGTEALAIWNRIDDIDFNGTKLKKSDRVELIACVMSDDTLFEGFCLAFYDSNERLENICDNYGCSEHYHELMKDPVYQNRKNYMQLVSKYVIAAVNLYGVIHLVEFEEILRGYEKKLTNYQGYSRENGTYQKTIIYQPRYIGLLSLQQLIGEGIPMVLTTFDGLLLHECYLADMFQERDDMMEFLASKKRQITEEDLDEFYTAVSKETSYRLLLMKTMEKECYLPSKNKFLRYAEDDYYEVSAAEMRFRQYIEKNYLANFSRVAKKVGVSTEECLNDFMREMRNQATDVGKTEDDRDPQDYVQFLFAAIQGYDILMEDANKVNEFLQYAMDVMNSVRLWSNRGYTPNELKKRLPINPKGLTIVPGSSHAAKILSEGREDLAKMGLQMDIDATATDVPTFSFADGIGGSSQKVVKKVYPNDLCPCGSGKKFKKCCGRK